MQQTGGAMDAVNLTEAAKAIGVNKSTLSRQLARGLFRNLGSEDRPLVSIAEVRARRDSSVDSSKSATENFGLRAPQAPQVFAPEPTQAPQGRASTFNDARAQSEQTRATLLELQLAEKTGEVVARAQVEAKAFETARRLRDHLYRIPSHLADKLSTMSDPREIRVLLKAEFDKALTSLVQDLAHPQPDDREHMEDAQP
jgi:hypothetical protein